MWGKGGCFVKTYKSAEIQISWGLAVYPKKFEVSGERRKKWENVVKV